MYAADHLRFVRDASQGLTPPPARGRTLGVRGMHERKCVKRKARVALGHVVDGMHTGQGDRPVPDPAPSCSRALL